MKKASTEPKFNQLIWRQLTNNYCACNEAEKKKLSVQRWPSEAPSGTDGVKLPANKYVDNNSINFSLKKKSY